MMSLPFCGKTYKSKVKIGTKGMNTMTHRNIKGLTYVRGTHSKEEGRNDVKVRIHLFET